MAYIELAGLVDWWECPICGEWTCEEHDHAEDTL